MGPRPLHTQTHCWYHKLITLVQSYVFIWCLFLGLYFGWVYIGVQGPKKLQDWAIVLVKCVCVFNLIIFKHNDARYMRVKGQISGKWCGMSVILLSCQILLVPTLKNTPLTLRTINLGLRPNSNPKLIYLLRCVWTPSLLNLNPNVNCPLITQHSNKIEAPNYVSDIDSVTYFFLKVGNYVLQHRH